MTESGRDEMKKSEEEEMREGVRNDGKRIVDGDRQRRPEEKRGGGDNEEDVLRTETGGTDLSLGLGKLAPRRRAESLTLHFDRLTLPADSGVTASSLAGLALNPQPGFSRALRHADL